MKSDTFCPIPWIFQAVRANGDIRVCCQANITKNQGVVKHLDGSNFNAGVDSLDDARNAPLMRTIRKNMLNGIWSDECGRCKQEEEAGLNSRRKYENDSWNYSIDSARAVTLEDGQLDTSQQPVIYYDLRFGNFCNLKCRMCGPTDSTAWYDDWVKMNGNKFKDTTGIIEIKTDSKGKYFTTEFDWHASEVFWNQLESNAHYVQHVYMAGGEPLLIERHFQFLQRCIDNNTAKNIILEYNTNMSTVPPTISRMWTSFKQVRIGASVDGMGAVQEYHRYPITWEKTLKNLQVVDSLPSNISAWLAFTVTVYNVHHMVDFMKWKLQHSNFSKINSTKRRPIITHHVAHNPKHLNIRVLPDSEKEIVKDKFNNFVLWVEVNQYPDYVIEQARSISNSIIKYMESDSYHAEFWQYFKDYTVNLDALRGQSIKTSIPELAKFFD